MPSPQTPHVRIGAKAILLGFIVSGCGGPKAVTDDSPEAKHVKNAGQLCQAYTTATKKRPASIDDVKAWAIKEGKATDEDFVSTRDKQPYGMAASPMGIILFEQSGKGGKRYLYQMGGAFEKPSAEIDQMVQNFGALKKTSGGPGPPKAVK